MKTIVIFLIILTLIVLIGAQGLIYEDNPCGIVNCRANIFGFWETKAIHVDTTPDGYAVCKCPHDPPEVLYFISLFRKY